MRHPYGLPLIVIAMALVSAVDNSVASVIIAIGISMLAWFLRMYALMQKLNAERNT